MKIDRALIDEIAKKNDESGEGFIDIFWEGEGEFGHIELHFYPDGKLEIDSEYMGKKFIKQVFEKLIDDAILKE